MRDKRPTLSSFDLAVLAAAHMDALEYRLYPGSTKSRGWFMGDRCVSKSLRRLVLAKQLYVHEDGERIGFEPERFRPAGWKTHTDYTFQSMTKDSDVYDRWFKTYPEVAAVFEKMKEDYLGSVSVDGLRQGSLGGGEDGCPPISPAKDTS